MDSYENLFEFLKTSEFYKILDLRERLVPSLKMGVG